MNWARSPILSTTKLTIIVSERPCDFWVGVSISFSKILLALTQLLRKMNESLTTHGNQRMFQSEGPHPLLMTQKWLLGVAWHQKQARENLSENAEPQKDKRQPPDKTTPMTFQPGSTTCRQLVLQGFSNHCALNVFYAVVMENLTWIRCNVSKMCI